MRIRFRLMFGLWVLITQMVTFVVSAQSVSGKINGHDYVDLGLPSGTLWATCNVGATKPEEYGDYFAWGETVMKGYYEKGGGWYDVSNDSLMAKGVIDSIGNLTAKYDAATANWGSDWRMPTKEEVEELTSLKNEYAEENGVEGRKFIGKNGATLFLPFAGRCYNGNLHADKNGFYWSASASDGYDFAHNLCVYSKDVSWLSVGRYFGFSVRPVLKTK